TKTDWCLTDGVKTAFFKTGGINPFFQNEEDVRKILIDGLLKKLPIEPITDVFFYGAGCASSIECARIRKLFKKIVGAEKVEVYSDLIGAARSLCGRSPGIVCILGTGSNSCYWNGTSVVKHTPALGFILGDEGSGAYIGRRLISDCLKGLLPASLVESFYKQFPYKESEILKKVYSEPFPNRFLASFAPFVAEHINEPEMRKLAEDAFADFMERNIMSYPYQTERVYMVGSVAVVFRNVIAKVALEHGIMLGNVTDAPIKGLAEYHTVKI
ncbi:MAG: ATPase, partial [Bacteroidales bacterium]